ncbi:MAG TPA: hypothetical protein VL993_14655, partial [Stellaceae bacterium]|nr:hypothetical protein [Stellaceae bacterium]
MGGTRCPRRIRRDRGGATIVSVALRVIAPGLSTTVQDLGRAGWMRFGVPPSGALDPRALAVANILVGNPAVAGALELT